MTLARVAATLAVTLLLGPLASIHAAPPEAARGRVEHHLRHVERLSGHFERLLNGGCPRFPSPAAWHAYVDTELEQVVLLAAHVEQAWAEAKRTGDDDVRRTAKAPRRQRDQARQLVDKLAACAEVNGAAFSPLALWRRVERDLPQRRMEIALPE
jgi:hypothetical protein